MKLCREQTVQRKNKTKCHYFARSTQSDIAWKISLTYPGLPVKGTAQKGQADWKPEVPHGIGTSAQYLTVLAEAM